MIFSGMLFHYSLNYKSDRVHYLKGEKCLIMLEFFDAKHAKEAVYARRCEPSREEKKERHGQLLESN